MKKADEKSKQRHYYTTDVEDEMINNLAKRIGVNKSKCVKLCMVSIAENPILEYVISNGVLLNTSTEVFNYYLSMLQLIDDTLSQLAKQGIDIESYMTTVSTFEIKKFKDECYSILKNQN